MTGDSEASDLSRSLLSDRHGQPVIWISDGHIESLNEPARQLLGLDAAGRAFSEFLDEQSAKKLERFLASGSSAKRTELQIEQRKSDPIPAAFAVMRAGGSDLVLMALSQGIAYPESVGQQLLAASSDLTESLRRLGREIHDARAAKETLERIEDLRDGFVAALAHDLRSPLNAVLLAETLLETDADRSDEQIASHVRLVERNIRLALELVDNVVSVSRIDAADAELKMQPVRLIDIARQWCDALGSVAAVAEVSLQVTADGSTDVHGDAVRLGEVFSNLLSNAIRHSPAGGQVSTELSKRGDELFCIVTDQGDGVPPSIRASIFDKFAQGSDSESGSGLGLYIARRIVELHGGRIWVEDNVPSGSRFVFALPVPPRDTA